MDQVSTLDSRTNRIDWSGRIKNRRWTRGVQSSGTAGKKQSCCHTQQAYCALREEVRAAGRTRGRTRKGTGGNVRRSRLALRCPIVGQGRACRRIAQDRKLQRKGRGARVGSAFCFEATHKSAYTMVYNRVNGPGRLVSNRRRPAANRRPVPSTGQSTVLPVH